MRVGIRTQFSLVLIVGGLLLSGTAACVADYAVKIGTDTLSGNDTSSLLCWFDHRCLGGLKELGLQVDIDVRRGAAQAFYYELDYGIDAGSASAEGIASSCNSIHLCVADIKSLGVMLEVSVSSSETSIMMIGSSKKLGIRDCCIFGDGERSISFDADAPLAKIPFAGQLEQTGEFKKIGVLYLRILKSKRLRPRAPRTRRGPEHI